VWEIVYPRGPLLEKLASQWLDPHALDLRCLRSLTGFQSRRWGNGPRSLSATNKQDIVKKEPITWTPLAHIKLAESCQLMKRLRLADFHGLQRKASPKPLLFYVLVSQGSHSFLCFRGIIYKRLSPSGTSSPHRTHSEIAVSAWTPNYNQFAFPGADSH
jgi:hypothetical protein